MKNKMRLENNHYDFPVAKRNAAIVNPEPEALTDIYSRKEQMLNSDC